MDIQILGHSDIDLLKDLQPTGWQDIIPIFDFYTNSVFCFPIKATIDNKIVGIGTTIIHNDIAWLAHIIVRPDNRNNGIGRLITQTLIDSLKAKNCDTIYLIATDLGAPVYEKLGFETETEYLCFKDIQTDMGWTISKNITLFTDDFKEHIANIDRHVSGEDRMLQIQQHLTYGYVYLQDKIIEGYYLPTLGEGLIIANTSSAGLELMKLRLTTKENIAFPIDNLSATEFLHKNNYKEFKMVKRMRLGTKRTWLPAKIYSRIGGHLG